MDPRSGRQWSERSRPAPETGSRLGSTGSNAHIEARTLSASHNRIIVEIFEEKTERSSHQHRSSRSRSPRESSSTRFPQAPMPQPGVSRLSPQRPPIGTSKPRATFETFEGYRTYGKETQRNDDRRGYAEQHHTRYASNESRGYADRSGPRYRTPSPSRPSRRHRERTMGYDDLHCERDIPGVSYVHPETKETLPRRPPPRREHYSEPSFPPSPLNRESRAEKSARPARPCPPRARSAGSLFVTTPVYEDCEEDLEEMRRLQRNRREEKERLEQKMRGGRRVEWEIEILDDDASARGG